MSISKLHNDRGGIPSTVIVKLFQSVKQVTAYLCSVTHPNWLTVNSLNCLEDGMNNLAEASPLFGIAHQTRTITITNVIQRHRQDITRGLNVRVFV